MRIGKQQIESAWLNGFGAERFPSSSSAFHNFTSFLIMKKYFVFLMLGCFAVTASAQTGTSPDQTSNSGAQQDTPYAITENSANSRTWERTWYEQQPSGQ